MKKYCVILCSLLFMGIGAANAQYVTIPDANFAAYLNTIIPSAMSGNKMDTTNAAVISLTRIDIENLGILTISGVQYFRNLITLDCGNGSPSIDSNHITSLPTLAVNLDTLICGNNQITSLPALPGKLQYLACYKNKLTSLPTLPGTLLYLNCDNNGLTSLPALPGNLTYLDCEFNQLTSIPVLPSNIIDFYCDDNHVTSLPALPGTIVRLGCANNQITNLPTLPGALTFLNCFLNHLPSLPTLPGGMLELYCSSNPITSIPVLPLGLQQFDCDNDLLTTLPLLPRTLVYLNCSSNYISCFPIFPNSLADTALFNISGNPFTCLPNYVPGMPKAVLNYPLCTPGNPNGCPPAFGIVGYTYKDINNNCIKNKGDSNLVNVPMKLYDNSNNLLSQTYTALNGVYDFLDTGATYKVLVDTSGMPYKVQCAHPGADSVLAIKGIDTNINFSLTCKSGFDVGVQSILDTGLVFPGWLHDLSVVAGDMSQWYNLDCADKDSGTVEITVSGPVKYVRPGAGALTPIVSGHVFKYHIPNYSAIHNTSAFNLIFKTDTNAKAGDTICAYVTVTPRKDNNPGNNTDQYCYYVVNSHDPNNKEVYPVNVAPNYNGWFTYTIHFQNTGNAAAKNVLIADTLDKNLNVSTFQLINYSHENTVTLSSAGVLTVRFSGINLPDSAANPAGSMGFVQYRIKPKANLPNGTISKNTGYIYFDYNGAIVTNTTQNLFTKSLTSVSTITSHISCKVYPNPSNGIFTIAINQPGTISETQMVMEIYNVLGEKIYVMPLQQVEGNNTINISNKPAGIYFYRIITQNGSLISEGKMIIK